MASGERACVVEAGCADVDRHDLCVWVAHRVADSLGCAAAGNQHCLDRVERSVWPDQVVRGTACPPISQLVREGVQVGHGWGVWVAVVEGFDRIRICVVHHGRACQALIIPALSLANTLSTLNDAGS